MQGIYNAKIRNWFYGLIMNSLMLVKFRLRNTLKTIALFNDLIFY